MAEIEYTYGVYGDELYAEENAAQGGDTSEHGHRATIGKAVNVAGALASLALVVGVGVWGYKLMMRDVSGVPVVRALEGPMRVLPEDPGGRPADHQGLAVNAVAAKGTAAAPSDRLALAPRPVRLSDEDAPMAKLDPARNRPGVETASVDSEAMAAFRQGQVDALVETLTAEPDAEKAPEERIVQPEPLADSAAQPSATATREEPESAPEPTNVQAAVLDAPGLRRSPRPLARPARLASADAMGADVVAALSAAQDAVARVEVEPESVPAGTRLAQLGAFDSAEVARTEWDRLDARFGEYLDGKQRVIQKASSGGRTFYRLRAMGFDDLSDARRFCSALVAENADCIPVTAR